MACPISCQRFNSRTPGGVRQCAAPSAGHAEEFQFTHPGRGATDFDDLRRRSFDVSIHAPREGCDSPPLACPTACQGFNSRTPGGVRLSLPMSFRLCVTFQFTHPGRGATCAATPQTARGQSFNSRTPGGVRRQIVGVFVAPFVVSIHAPREGCDILYTEGSIY